MEPMIHSVLLRVELPLLQILFVPKIIIYTGEHYQNNILESIELYILEKRISLSNLWIFILQTRYNLLIWKSYKISLCSPFVSLINSHS